MFEIPGPTNLETRVIQLEIALAQLTGTVGGNLTQVQAAIAQVSAQRAAGDLAGSQALDAEIAARLLSIAAVDDRTGAEIVRAIDMDEQLAERIDLLATLNGGALVPRSWERLPALTGLPSDALLIIGTENKSYKISAALFAQLIGGDGAMAANYPFYLSGVTVDGDSSNILAGDAKRTGILLQCNTADIAINFNSGEADFEDGSSFVQYAGQAIFHGDVGIEGVNIKARWPLGAELDGPVSAPLFARVDRSENVAPPSDTTVDTIVGAWPDASDVRLRLALREVIPPLVASGVWAKLGYVFLAGASANNNAVNLANPAGLKAVYHPGQDGLQTVPYHYIKGGGTDAVVQTGLMFADAKMALDSHSLGVFVDGQAASPDGYTMGFSINLFVQANRSLSAAGFRSGSGTDTHVADPGGWVGLSRLNANEYMQFIGRGLVETRQRVGPTAVPTRSLNLLGINGTPGYANCTALPVRAAFAGAGLTAEEYGSVVDALASLLAACDEIRENPV